MTEAVSIVVPGTNQALLGYRSVDDSGNIADAEALAPFTRRQPNDGAERPLLKRLDWSAIYARVQVVETLILNALARRMAEDDEDDDEVLILNG